MSNRSGPWGERSTERPSRVPLPAIAFTAVLAFMIGGLLGGATTTQTPTTSPDVLFVNGPTYGIVFLTLLVAAVGYGVGGYLGNRR